MKTIDNSGALNRKNFYFYNPETIITHEEETKQRVARGRQ